MKNYMGNWLYEKSVENTSELIYQVGTFIDKIFINGGSQITSMISGSSEVKNSSHKLTKYLEYNPSDFQYIPSDEEVRIENYFENIKKNYDEVNFIFLGLEDGGYIEYPRFIPSETYDPRERPWYVESMKNDEIVISDPYTTKMTNETVVSFTKKINLENSSGVVGVSFTIDKMAQMIKSAKVPDTGCLVVLNSNNKVIFIPKNPKWIKNGHETFDFKILTDENFIKRSYYETNYSGMDIIVNRHISPYSEWKVYSLVPKDDIISKSKEITNILMIIYILTLLIILIIIIAVSSRMTDPILRISSIINNLAVFDFESYDEQRMKLYIERKDEIGIVSKAINNMHENFIELKNTLEKVDNKLKNIDVEKDEKIEFILSTNNPFKDIMNSFNELLKKNYSYMKKLKTFNNEILEKNQLLTASEEELIAQLEEINSQKGYIDFLASHDPLTELPNRRMFIEKLNFAIASKISGAVILMDLDNFKGINDTLGHVYGDKVLYSVASKLKKISSEDSFVSRFGGDEFLILVQNKNSYNEIKEYAEKIQDLFKENLIIDENNIDIKFSMGISLFPKDSYEVDKLIMNADLALYDIKNSGKNDYNFFNDTMMEKVIRNSQIENKLKNSIEEDGFKILYQPLVDAKTGYIYGYEALIRIIGSDISPSEFIPVSEENGMIISIGRIVVSKVIEQLKKWKDKGLKIKPIAINFSASQMHDYDFLNFIDSEFEKFEVDPKSIEIEITENIFLENKEGTIEFLNNLKSRGMKIAIDDFGTGYSSLSYLTFLPIDKIKLDQSLNNKFLYEESSKVVDSLISLAHNLNLEVVAEGIETKEQMEKLCLGKCDYIQGYYFSKPIEAYLVEENINNNYMERAYECYQ